MPPRKRTKVSAASTPLAETQSQPKTPVESGPPSQSQTSPQNENLFNDPWTDDQETQLFKSMIRWKPTGLHKHFRMICIHNNLQSHGFASSATPHTRIPGIWNKLDQLYDLRALNERENAFAFNDEPDPFDPEDSEKLLEFHLPEEEFGDLMWDRRFNVEPTSSPPFVPASEYKPLYRPGFGFLNEHTDITQDDTPSGVSPSTKTKGVARGRGAGRGRGGRGAQAAKSSKAQSTVSESAEEEDEEEEEEDEEESEESEEEVAPTKARGSRRGRPARRGRKR